MTLFHHDEHTPLDAVYKRLGARHGRHAVYLWLLAKARERKALVAAIGPDVDALARFNDERRSSLNDICGLAFRLATRLEGVGH